MATCELCGREMNEARGCVPHFVVLRNGDVIEAPRHTQLSSLSPREAAGRCHDCGAEPGGVHHPFCDSARTPAGRQLLREADEYVRGRPGGGSGLLGGAFR